MQIATRTDTPAPTDNGKDQIIDLLDKWICQRPGLAFGNYGDVPAYRAEQRSIARDKREAQTLLRYVVDRNSITADMLREGFRAYSGRLSLGTDSKGRPCLDYCTGQYWPTEYRKAACAVLASVIWDYLRDKCMPAPDGYRVQQWAHIGRFTHVLCASRETADLLLADLGGAKYGHVAESYHGLSAGDFLHRAARSEFGRAIADRWLT